jgi:hypothetical protein
VHQAVSELTGLVGEANSLLATSTQLEAKYLALPSYAERRNSMQLLEDTQVDPYSGRAGAGPPPLTSHLVMKCCVQHAAAGMAQRSLVSTSGESCRMFGGV